MPSKMVRDNGNVVVELTPDEYATVCGMLAPSNEDPNGINQQGIYTDVWDSLRRKFPRKAFFDRVKKHRRDLGSDYEPGVGPLSYDPSAGE